MITGSVDGVSGAVLATKGLRLGSSTPSPTMHNGNHKSRTSSEARKGRDLGTKDEGSGQAGVVTAKPQLSFTPQMALVPNSGNCGCVCYTSNNDANHGAWLLDSGATDHMTFAATDFVTTSLTKSTNIANANGFTSPATGTGTMVLSPMLQLHNTLLVPSLYHKLLSVS
ncbi:hypothetical protein Pint_09109 [Pistacia integerrima]|uniref:Uncharacterized protein n=1 Tax=Pistacia integerrima TaxID=434235 RepID=A0ACC0XX29_9ROSI|nr:hypothetical protein Pint_09109 [Pistacia integerrima]